MSEQRVRREVSVINWIGTLILAAIPVVNLVFFVIWAVSSKRPSKRNYAIAVLILIVLSIVATILACAFYGAQISEFFAGLYARTAAQFPVPTVAATPAPMM